MTILYLPTLISFLAFLALGAYVFLRNKGHRVNLFFALGMGSLALMEFGNFMALLYFGSEASLSWKRISLLGECLIPGIWLAFSMSFARMEPRNLLKEWKTVFILIGLTSAFFATSSTSSLFVRPGSSPAIVSLGGIGMAFYTFFLLGMAAVVAHLEHTIRQSKGTERIRIKSFVLGLGGLFAFLIFTTSQTLLFFQINLGMVPVSSSVFIICSAVIAFSVVRHRLMEVNVYMSRFVIYNSLTVVVVGGYLVFVGIGSQVIRSFNLIPGFPLEILFLFVAILLFSSLFISERVRWKARMFINRHFYRSRYDYREQWLKFSEALSLKPDIEELVSPIVNTLQETVAAKEVSLWLGDTTTGELILSGPGSSKEKRQLKLDQRFLKVLVEKRMPFSLEAPWARAFFLDNNEILNKFQPSLVVPVVSRKELNGLIFLGKKTTGEPFLSDDFDLLKSASAQIASAIVNAKLSQKLIETKEMETFHRFSSFVLHDLKNLVSSLSLIVQNTGEHMGNPQFQQDALKTVGRSVEKMAALIARLSNNTGDLRPNLQETNLNDVVSGVAGRIEQNGRGSKAKIQTYLGNIPTILADRVQIEKVVGNLLLNAFEASTMADSSRSKPNPERIK